MLLSERVGINCVSSGKVERGAVSNVYGGVVEESVSML
jgi:hypothetical protein